MNRRNTAIAALLTPLFLLSACGGKESQVNEVYSSSAKSALATIHTLAKQMALHNRPSGSMGIFAGLYLAQGAFLPTKASHTGMETVTKIQQGQLSSTSDENFALLREVGDILQVNVVDVLNRSEDRTKALDVYIESLYSAGRLMERKLEELKALSALQKEDESEKRAKSREIERSLRDALNVPDYQAASEYEQQLTTAKVAYTESEAKRTQTEDMIDRFDALVVIASKRLRVVENNREILLAGLRVINMPGIGDLDILEEGDRWRRNRGMSLFTKPISG